MDVFRVCGRLVEDYREFTGSFVDIHDTWRLTVPLLPLPEQQRDAPNAM